MVELKEIFTYPTDPGQQVYDRSARVYRPQGAFAQIGFLPQSPDWDSYLCTELLRLQSLPTNWDGYNSPPVDPRIAHDARNVLVLIDRLTKDREASEILHAPYLVPISGGGLQAEWHIKGKIIEIFFDHELHIEAHFYSDADEEELDEDHVLQLQGSHMDVSKIIEWLDRLSADDAA